MALATGLREHPARSAWRWATCKRCGSGQENASQPWSLEASIASLPGVNQVLLSMRMARSRQKNIARRLGIRTEKAWSRCRRLARFERGIANSVHDPRCRHQKVPRIRRVASRGSPRKRLPTATPKSSATRVPPAAKLRSKKRRQAGEAPRLRASMETARTISPAAPASWPNKAGKNRGVHRREGGEQGAARGQQPHLVAVPHGATLAKHERRSSSERGITRCKNPTPRSKPSRIA